MRLALSHQNIEIAIEDESNDEQAYVQISTDATVTVQGAAGEKHVIDLDEDLTLED